MIRMCCSPWCFRSPQWRGPDRRAGCQRRRSCQEALEPGRGPDQRAVPVQLQRRFPRTATGSSTLEHPAGDPDLDRPENWNVISRTIVPIVQPGHIVRRRRPPSGLGATTQSFFFSPKKPRAVGLIWGVGPAFLSDRDRRHRAPTSGAPAHRRGAEADRSLDGRRARQPIWSITGDDEDGDISATFLQPFVNYTTPKATSFSLNTESTYDWETERVVGADQRRRRPGGEDRPSPVQFSVGARYWAEAPEGGPEAGARFQVTLLFPK